jgi:hypothetical protein
MKNILIILSILVLVSCKKTKVTPKPDPGPTQPKVNVFQVYISGTKTPVPNARISYVINESGVVAAYDGLTDSTGKWVSYPYFDGFIKNLSVSKEGYTSFTYTVPTLIYIY